MGQATHHTVYRPRLRAAPARVATPYARGLCEDPTLERTLLTSIEQARTLIKARCFPEARARLELAVSRVRYAQETIPKLRLNLLSFARLLSLYGALLTQLERFSAAQHAQGHMMQALDLFLVAGSLFPPADEIDIPEFEFLTRELGERALREPHAFATLQTLLRRPEVQHRDRASEFHHAAGYRV